MDVESLLRPLPRTSGASVIDLQPRVRRQLDGTDWPLLPTLARSVRWLAFGLRLGGQLAWDRRRGPWGTRQVAARLRVALERMGGPAVKFGQQMANRVDLLPFEFCMELSRLTDRVSPFPTEQAILEIERALGGPLESVFRTFDPKPIGSASIACVYQGVLKSGEKVAVKVQRPGIAEQFTADLAIMAIGTRALEALALVRPGFFHFMRQEVRTMFLEELDFTLEARFQHHYRRFIRRDRIDWLTCPRLWRQWCGPRVLVAEFIDGIPCSEILSAVETNDHAALAQLAALDIDPLRVGVNIVRLSFWSNYELPFIHGDPHPANLMVLPGGRLCMLDFGACSPRMRRTANIERQLVECLVADDVSGMTAAVLADISPLPHIDLDAFRRDVEAKMLTYTRGLRDPSSSWFERTTVMLWIHMVEGIRRYNLQVNPDTLRTIRATLLYDTLAFRLNPKINLDEARRYFEKLPLRQVRRARRRHDQNRAGGPPSIRLAQRWQRVGEQLRQAEYLINRVVYGMIPSLYRLAGDAARIGRWLGFWALVVGAAWWCCEPTPFEWILLGLVVSISGMRLAHYLREESALTDAAACAPAP